MRAAAERQRRALAVVLALLALLATAGCASKAADAGAPPTAQPSRTSSSGPPPPAAVSEPQTQVSLPPEQAIPEGAAPEPGPPLPPLPDPSQPQTPSRQSVRTQPPAPSRPTPPQVEPERNPAPQPPILSAILSDSEKREYNRIIDGNVGQTKRNLELLSGRALSEDQRAAIKRIRAFLRQTEEAQQDDLALARSLSERARLLAEDLVRNSL